MKSERKAVASSFLQVGSSGQAWPEWVAVAASSVPQAYSCPDAALTGFSSPASLYRPAPQQGCQCHSSELGFTSRESCRCCSLDSMESLLPREHSKQPSITSPTTGAGGYWNSCCTSFSWSRSAAASGPIRRIRFQDSAWGTVKWSSRTLHGHVACQRIAACSRNNAESVWRHDLPSTSGWTCSYPPHSRNPIKLGLPAETWDPKVADPSGTWIEVWSWQPEAAQLHSIMVLMTAR